MTSDNGRSPTWVNVRVKLGDLKPWQLNPRHITMKQAKRLAESFDAFGQVETIAVGPDLDVYNGHQRLSVLHKLHGPDLEIDARQADRPLTDEERRKLVVYLHAGAVGGWDWDALSSWPADNLMQWGFDGDLLGDWKKDIAALGNLLESETPEPQDAEPQIDRAEELNQKWRVKIGDLWRIGEHRLLCGDSAKREDVERVMQGERAQFICIDPPYKFHYHGGGVAIRNISAEFKERIEPLSHFEPRTLFNVLDGLQYGSACIWSNKELLPDYLEYAKSKGLLFNVFVWTKDNPPPFVKNTWLLDIEYIIWLGGSDRHFTNGLEYKDYSRWYQSGIHQGKNEGNDLHPTIKPLEFIERFVKVNSAELGIVVDLFLGSGTTMIACQNLGRKCRAIEISPAYCAVTLERMATAFLGIEIERIT